MMGTLQLPGSVIPSKGHGFGFLCKNTTKSNAYSFGTMTRFAYNKKSIEYITDIRISYILN